MSNQSTLTFFGLKQRIETSLRSFNSKNLGLNEQATVATVKKIALAILAAAVAISAIKLVMVPFALLACIATFSVTALCIQALVPELFQKIKKIGQF